ncbi:hypothetical protein BJX76DRAFT_20787 [Aspergillus varians]
MGVLSGHTRTARELPELQKLQSPIIQTFASLSFFLPSPSFSSEKRSRRINITGVDRFPFAELFVQLPLPHPASQPLGIFASKGPQTPRLTQPPSCSPVTLYPLDVFETLLTTSHLLLLLPRVFTPICASFPSNLTPTELIPSPAELPHRTSLPVLPLKEEGSRRLGPVNYGCETFRPP